MLNYIPGPPSSGPVGCGASVTLVVIIILIMIGFVIIGIWGFSDWQ